jgi:hypothetical protein
MGDGLWALVCWCGFCLVLLLWQGFKPGRGKR